MTQASLSASGIDAQPAVDLSYAAAGAVIRESDYTYDPFDKRIGVSVDPDGYGPEVATERWTVYDGANPELAGVD